MTSKSNSKRNPHFSSSNIFSRLCLSRVSTFLRQSRHEGVLQTKHSDDHQSRSYFPKLTDQLQTNWLAERQQSSQHPNFLRVTLRTMSFKLFLIGFLLILYELAKVAQPILLIQLMHFFEPCSTMSIQSACFFAGATVFSALSASFFYHSYFYLIQILGVEMRNAQSSLIVQKMLRLSVHAINTIGSGKINNLISNDTSQIEFTLLFINYLWVAPLQLIIVTVIFWYYVQYIALIPVVYVVIILAIQILTSRLCIHFRSKISQFADSRLKLVTEVVKSMRVVKIFCLESIFKKKTSNLRKCEMKAYAHHSMIVCGQKLLSHSFVPVTFLLMYIAMWLLNIQLDTKFFVVATCLLTYMRLSIIDFLNFAIQNVSKYLVASRRMQDFLTSNDFERDTRLSSECAFDANDIQQNEHTALLLTTNQTSPELQCNITEATWNKDLSFALRDISFNASPGDLVCVVGPVGSGKTSLLQTLLGEITCFDREKCQLSGSVCYVPQEPWIFSATIKENILFGSKYDKPRMKRILRATALDTDLEKFSTRHHTLVGDQGVMLSGGQKSRIDLARALYRDADIYLLDDPFSALDAHVSAHIYENVFEKHLKNKICVMVTHQVRFLKHATKIIVLDKGNVMAIGTYDELRQTPSIAHLLESVNRPVQQEEEHAFSFERQLSVAESTCSTISNEEELPSPRASVETRQEGQVSWHVFSDYLRAGIGLIPGFILLFGLFSAQQGVTIYSSWKLAAWSIDENSRYHIPHTCKRMISQQNNSIRNFTDAQWDIQRNQHFFTYCGIVAVLIVITFLRIVTIDMILLNAGRVLHNRMFQRIIRCPIHFFYSNLGQILNRFTKDFSIIDNQLPYTFFDFFYCLFQVLGAVVFVSILNPWSLIPAALAAVWMLVVRSYFAQSSRDLKRLEGTSRSPIFSHLISMIQGLQVIRSYRAEDTCLKEFSSHLNKNTRVKYSFIATIQWAGIRFDWISLSFIVLVTSFAMLFHATDDNFSAINIALTLTYSLNLVGLFQWTIRQSVDVETQMTAVERVLEYSSLEQEPQSPISGDSRPPTDWPSRGEIVYENVSMKHLPGEGTPLALNNISFTIDAGERVGIVGRTGAGKSSLIHTLFRMGFLTNGRVIIDGIDIATINLDDLRQRISIIPQDPILFSGTLRFNLDPLNIRSDEEIWTVLEKIKLKTQIIGQMQNGLDSVIAENGFNMNVGQKQLVCLTRAILKKTKILLIDEGIASVDNATAAIIQNTIRDYVENCTILTIAHRLDTVVDSNRIMVLGDAQLLEYDTPENLRANPKSHFSLLWNQMNSMRSKQLQTISEIDTITTA